MTLAIRAVRAVAGNDTAAAFTTWGKRKDRYWHRASSGLMSVLLAQSLAWPAWQQSSAVVIGVTFGGGLLSPDVDNARVWRAFDERFPDRWAGSPLRHHGATHSVSIAAALVVGLFVVGAPWFVWWIPLVWIMHDLGDVMIGHGWQGEAGPCWVLWWSNWGFDLFKSGGFMGVLGTIACWVGIGWRLWAGAFS